MDQDKLVMLAKQFAVEKSQRLPEILAARTPVPLAVVDDRKWKRPTKHVAERPKPTQVAPKRSSNYVPRKKTK